METNRFLVEAPAAEFATQSGPMLLIDGEIHPRFLPDSDSRKIRNGVGIVDEHIVAFVLAESPVTFYEFARLFRDRLVVLDALFLDGSVSEIYMLELNRHGLGWFGPMLGVVERQRLGRSDLDQIDLRRDAEPDRETRATEAARYQ